MVRGIRRTTPIIEDANVDVTIANVLDTGLTFTANGTATHSIIDDIKELEKKVAELSLRDPKPRRRVKSIKIKF